MRPRLAFVLLALVVALFGLAAVSVASAPAPAALAPLAPAAVVAQPGNAFIHVSTAANTDNDSTFLDEVTLNNNPNAKMFAISVRSPYGDGLAANDQPLGVWYNLGLLRWGIYNENDVTMTRPLAWNVFVPPPDTTVIVHLSSSGNISGSQTFIDDPQFNNAPDALIFVQHVYNPSPQVTDNLYTHTVAVAYSPARQKWAIMNADGSPFPSGISFFVLKASPDEAAFTHITSSANQVLTTSTRLDNPLINNDPNAEILVTQNFGTGVTNLADNHRLALTYDAGSGRWLVQHIQPNPNPAALPNGVMFNVLVIPPKTGFLVQTVSEFGSYHSVINNPDLNNNPYARVYVVHNYSAPEASGVHFNNHPLGVFYNAVDHHWHIFNRDYSPLEHGSAYNVYYTWPQGNSFTASSNAENTTGSYMTLNNPLLNSQPQALALTSFNLNPNGATGVVYTPTTGLTFNPTPQAWDIFNQPGPNFPARLSYNVLIPGADSFVVTATVLSADDNHLFIDSPLTNGDPQALVFVTPRSQYGPGLDNKNVGVYWDGTGWAIFNENTADAMPLGAVFNVFVIKRRMVYLPEVTR